MKNTKDFDVRELRKKTGRNQTAFYSRIGLTQSCGSRLESGRPLCKPYKLLLTLAYGTDAQAKKVFEQLRAKGEPGNEEARHD